VPTQRSKSLCPI